MPRPSRSAGQNPPVTSSHPSNASAAAHSTHTQNVHRNFGIGTLADKAHDLVARRIAGGDGARLPMTFFGKTGSAAVGHPDLHWTQARRAHPLTIIRHSLWRRLWALGPGGTDGHLKFVLCNKLQKIPERVTNVLPAKRPRSSVRKYSSKGRGQAGVSFAA